MNELNEYSYIWGKDKEKYVLLNDEYGKSILFLNDDKLGFLLIEDDELANHIISKMLNEGNRMYNSIIELKNSIGID